jgi:farnesyl diphosphate synthase
LKQRSDFTGWQKQAQTHAEQTLTRLLPPATQLPAPLIEAMRYATLDGGKRLRPMLVLAAAELGNAITEAVNYALAAVECIHIYSLVHDDMPEMDNDSLRHGKAACHIQYTPATALLVGDALQSMAFSLLSQPTSLEATRQLRMIQTLAQAAGCSGMAGGQAIDLAHVGLSLNQTELEHMHQLKTSALIRAAVTLGGLCCPDIDQQALTALDRYATHLGLAFQVIDDVLDYEQDSNILGKTAGKDAQANKPTYVSLMGLATARRYAENLIQKAIDALADFDQRAVHLRALAQFVVARNH